MLTDLAMCEIDSSQWASGMEVDQSDDSCSKGKASALKALSNNLQVVTFWIILQLINTKTIFYISDRY